MKRTILKRGDDKIIDEILVFRDENIKKSLEYRNKLEEAIRLVNKAIADARLFEAQSHAVAKEMWGRLGKRLIELGLIPANYREAKIVLNVSPDGNEIYTTTLEEAEKEAQELEERLSQIAKEADSPTELIDALKKLVDERGAQVKIFKATGDNPFESFEINDKPRVLH